MTYLEIDRFWREYSKIIEIVATECDFGTFGGGIDSVVEGWL